MSYKPKSSPKDMALVHKLMDGLAPHEEKALSAILDDLARANKEVAQLSAVQPDDLMKQLTAENVARIAEIEALKAQLMVIPPKPELLQKPFGDLRCKKQLPTATSITVRQTAKWSDDGKEIHLTTAIKREYYCPDCKTPMDAEEESRRTIPADGIRV